MLSAEPTAGKIPLSEMIANMEIELAAMKVIRDLNPSPALARRLIAYLQELCPDAVQVEQ